MTSARGTTGSDGALPILLDATSLPPNRGGVARYIVGLLSGLDRLGHSITVVTKERDVESLRSAAPSHRYVLAPKAVDARPARLIWEQVGLPRLARRLGARVVHSPHYTFPLLRRGASVVTVHDATFFTDPAVHSRLKRLFFTTWTRLALRRARAIVSPSRATIEALREHVGRIRGSAVVAYLAIDADVFRPPAPEAGERFGAQNDLPLERGWIAFLGTIEPRKNVPALIRAHRTLTRTRAAEGRTTPVLALSGARGWDAEAASLLDTRPEGVRELGYLPIDDLPAFLGSAALVAYPSLGEGFGLPVLEAMACGSAVLTTPRLSIPEVGGDAVVYSEPDEASLTAALADMLDDPAMTERLRSAAVLRAAEFTWEACAREHLRAYADAGVTP
ncbi:glycosyl transferase [Cnuibacter physcomitrellae]|uniref:glycosyltransferase family 4 protein n=1 Tax=Cnuibacter physcomitrellae TaxID=1619308 RepID=UPI0012F492A3|nr:glycosyltransferase family 1 protein [Cnuibacter physcomitrellae]GGI36986.1 glycosyl transferase [Cnuibacter physcomitrellae]